MECTLSLYGWFLQWEICLVRKQAVDHGKPQKPAREFELSPWTLQCIILAFLQITYFVFKDTKSLLECLPKTINSSHSSQPFLGGWPLNTEPSYSTILSSLVKLQNCFWEHNITFGLKISFGSWYFCVNSTPIH